MNLENYLFDDLSKENHQSYIQSRQQQGMNYIADYNEWLEAINELEKLEKNYLLFEDSEHNPENYPDYYKQPKDVQKSWIKQGIAEYKKEIEQIDAQISHLKSLLFFNKN